MDAATLLRVLFQFYCLMLVGYLLAKWDILDHKTNRKMSSMVVSATYPATLLCSMQAAPSDDRATAILLTVGSFLLYAALSVMAEALAALFRVPADRRSGFVCMLVFANTGFIGAPLAQSIFGGGAFFQINLLNIAYFFYYNTFARWEMGRGRDQTKPVVGLRDFLTPSLISVILTLAFYLTGITLPALVTDTLSLLGQATTPLSMLVLGSSLAAYPIRSSVTDPWTYLFSLCKLVLIPAAGWAVCQLLPIPAYYQNLSTLSLAMPAGSLVLMLALQLKLDDQFITRSVFISTLLSAVTLPAAAALFLR